MQNVALDLDEEDLTDLGKAKVLDAVQAQIGYLRAAASMVEQALFSVGPEGKLPG